MKEFKENKNYNSQLNIIRSFIYFKFFYFLAKQIHSKQNVYACIEIDVKVCKIANIAQYII